MKAPEREHVGHWAGASFARWFRRNFVLPAPEIFHERDLREAYIAGIRAQMRFVERHAAP